jgi:hypothetical protein
MLDSETIKNGLDNTGLAFEASAASGVGLNPFARLDHVQDKLNVVALRHQSVPCESLRDSDP